MSIRYLFIGLGNPGKEYEHTRHNIGREALLAAMKRFGLPAPEADKFLESLARTGKIGKTEVAFVFPETFMNKSGRAAPLAQKRFKVKPDHIVLIHDDVDMLLGRTKLSFGRNSGGHKGVESVMRGLKTKDFWRMRIGVQRKKRIPGEDLVLQKFRSDEETIAKKIIKKTVNAIETIVGEGPEKAMNEYNA
jgi:PTH1 family peptidyl-tRNA hydrolase